MLIRYYNPAPSRFVRGLSFCLLFAVSSGCYAELRVIDDLGREIFVAAPVERIVSLAPANTENLFTAGAGDRIVGAVEHSDYPQLALSIPRIGSAQQLNTEAILSLKPDLVVAWASGNPRRQVQRLIDLGLTVYYSEPLNIEGVISTVSRLSELTGQAVGVSRVLSQMRETYTTLKRTYQVKSPVKVFYQVWDKPLITLNGTHSISDALGVCGGVNVFANASTIAPKVSIERVIAENPALILLAGHNPEQSLAWRQGWHKWPSIQAVKTNQVHHIDASLVNRPTRRFLDGTRQICERIDQVRSLAIKSL